MKALRVCYRVSLVVGLGLVGFASLLYLRCREETPRLVVAQPHQIVHDLLPGTSRDVEFCIQNPTGHVRRIVGAIDNL